MTKKIKKPRPVNARGEKELRTLKLKAEQKGSATKGPVRVECEKLKRIDGGLGGNRFIYFVDNTVTTANKAVVVLENE